MPKETEKQNYKPSFTWWLIAIVLGSSSVAALVSIGWQEIQKLIERPAYYEIIDIGQDESRGFLNIILRNEGDKAGVITGIIISGARYDSFYTDQPITARGKVRKSQMQQADSAYVPGGEFVVFAVPHKQSLGDIIKLCIEGSMDMSKRPQCLELDLTSR